MKIAHIVCAFPPYYSGMGNVVFQTASHLIARGHEVTVFTPQYAEPQDETIDFAKRLAPSLSYGNAARLPSLEKELADADIVHLHYPFFGTANIVRRFKKKHPDIPLVVTYHMDTRTPGWKGLIFSLYARFFMPKILESADLIIGSSEDYILASDAGKIYQMQKEKWLMLPFGVDTERFSPGERPEFLFQQHKLDRARPTVLFVGAMDSAHYFKGVPMLLKALTALKNNSIFVQAFFVGDGPLKEQYELTARGLGISDRVRFVGRVSDEELPMYYQAADICILPSTTVGEAFGMVLLEAVASGVPVIASDLPGVRTVAEHGGMTVPPNDPMSLAQAISGYLEQSTEEKREWRLRVRKNAIDTYSWDRITDQLEQHYFNLVQRRRK